MRNANAQPASGPFPAAAERIVILDTDPGVDDAMALFYLNAIQGLRLHSITTVFGNGPVEVTARNASYLVRRFGLSVPVFSGAPAPLIGERFVPELKVHGSDGLGDTGAADDFAAHLPEVPAWSHIADTIAANPGRVTVLAIAPLTNLALALRVRPEIADLVDEVVVMGGAFGTKRRTGNIRSYAEANFFYDPLAADAVLAADWPVTVVGLDVSSDCILPSTASAELEREGGEVGAFLHAISRNYENIYREFDGIDGYCVHDVAAAAYVVCPDWFETIERRITVDASGPEAGASRFSDSESGMPSARPTQRICIAVNDAAVIESFRTAIAAYGDRSVPHHLSGERQ